MFSHRVKVDFLFDRLSAEAYSPAYIENEKKLDESAIPKTTLGNVVIKPINNSIRDIKGELDLQGAVIPMYRPADIVSSWLNTDTAPKISFKFEMKHQKARVYPGDILLAIAGTVASCGRVPSDVDYAGINGSSARVSTKEEDSGYVLSYLNSSFGYKALMKYGVGSVQKHLNLIDLPAVSLALPSALTRKYIGDKICQAELLRSWSKSTNREIRDYHQRFIPVQTKLNFAKKTRLVSTLQMTERMDAHFYPGVVDSYLNQNPDSFGKLSYCCISIFNGQTQPVGNDNFCEQVTVANLSPDFIKGKARVVEAPNKRDKFTKKYDLLMCNAAHQKSYIGKDITFVHSDKALLPSTEVMVIRPDTSKIPASYLRTYFLSKLGFVQIQSTIRGITAHSYPVDMAKLDIFIPNLEGKELTDWLGTDDLLVKAGIASEFSTQLTASAKLIVEALIEGKITETEIITAQQALENDDNTKDRAILSKLTDKGYAVKEGKPLFSDLEALYELLEEAQQDKDQV